MKTKEQPINDHIQAETVRLVGEEGEQLGTKAIAEARQLAEDAGVDLVLVAPNADPPVCKLMDFGKFKYRQKKRQHEHHHHSPQIKELRMRPKTEEHDLLVRTRKAREFLERGDRVLVTVRFRGREMAHTELAIALLERFSRQVEDLAKVEKTPSMEHRRMTMILVRK